MIRGYPRRPRVLPGEALTLHVSTDQPSFRVDFYRAGSAMERMEGVEPTVLEGYDYPPGPTDRDWGWPGYEFRIPPAWPSGCYVAMLTEVDASGAERRPDVTRPDGEEAKALFVVGSASPGVDTQILYKVPWATYHAYNITGYGSLYDETVWSEEYPQVGFKVTTRRPGGGAGGFVMMNDAPDYYSGGRRQTLAQWDWPMIRWLERRGYRVDYCTDLDLHEDPTLLDPYNLLLSVGHDEYWSAAMRSAIDRFVHAGGNVAYFSGNIASWRIHIDDDGSAITCAKLNPGSFEERTWESDFNLEHDPENRTTGVAIHDAGGWWDGKREARGYRVQHAGHWIYERTQLAEGDVFGDDEDQPLVGYECDGADFKWRDGIAVATGLRGTPSSFFILGIAELDERWNVSSRAAAATMGVYTSSAGGTVFQGATTDWPRALDHNEHVDRITRNVIESLRLPSLRVLGPLPGIGGRMLAAEGEVASFHVDSSALSADEHVELRWRIGGAEGPAVDAPRIDVTMPSPPRPVTVSVTAWGTDGPIGFGTQTFLPLSREDRLKVEVVNAVREMVTPGDPRAPIVASTLDPVDVARSITTVMLVWMGERADRLARLCAELVEIRTRDGMRPVNVDRRRPWVPKDADR